MSATGHYRRVLVIVREGYAEPRSFRLAAELAHLLQLELEGMFVEDEALVFLSGLPFARELSLPGHIWQAMDAARMLEDLRVQASEARRLLADAAAGLGIASRFSVLRGDPHGAVFEHGRAEDILVVVEPGAGFGIPARDIFRHTRSAVLLVPARPALRHHGIALVLSGRAAHAIQVAAAIARAAGEDVVLIMPAHAGLFEAEVEAEFRALGIPPARLRRRHVAGHDAGLIARAVRAAGARMVVLDRADLGEDVQGASARLLTEAGAAVLLIGTSD